MRHAAIRSQLVLVSVILLATFIMMMALVKRYNSRWDLTQDKIFSLSEPTEKLLEELSSEPIDVMAFYPHEDEARRGLEVFFKQCELKHPAFKYRFYDPDRVPSLAKEYHIKDIYTVVIRYAGRQERVLLPNEESFTNALLRLAHPKRFEACFVTGHGEPLLSEENRTGFKMFRQALEDNSYGVHEIILDRDRVPELCQMAVVAGPHRNLSDNEFRILSRYFREGGSLLLLIDPMEEGEGKSFEDFLAGFGVELGRDVVVDKASRMVGGDFLIPLVNGYNNAHPITQHFNQPTFFPVARSVRPTLDDKDEGRRVEVLALTTSGSWAETDLKAVERGEASFDQNRDLAGPFPIAASVESKPDANALQGGRMVVVGDSDFVSNGYFELSGNRDFALNSIQWLSRDDRFIQIRPRGAEFQPLYLMDRERTILFGAAVGGLPLFLLGLGSYQVIWRRRTG